MATLSTSIASVGQAEFGKTNIVSRLVKSITNSLNSARTYNELNRLSDAELRDIGIYRSEIRAIAFGVK